MMPRRSPASLAGGNAGGICDQIHLFIYFFLAGQCCNSGNMTKASEIFFCRPDSLTF